VLRWQPRLAVGRSQSDDKEKFVFLSASSGGSGRRSQKGRGSAVDVEGGAELMRNPEAMAKAQAEVRRALDSKNPGDHESLLGCLSYTGMVIKETIKHYIFTL
jgi:hypothetical protein